MAVPMFVVMLKTDEVKNIFLGEYLYAYTKEELRNILLQMREELHHPEVPMMTGQYFKEIDIFSIAPMTPDELGRMIIL